MPAPTDSVAISAIPTSVVAAAGGDIHPVVQGGVTAQETNAQILAYIQSAIAVTAAQISNASADGRSLLTAANYAAMKTLLALVIGTNVQAWDADLDTLAGMGGTRAGLLAALPAYIQTLLDDVDALAARATLVAAPRAATYITQTADSELSAEQALGALASGYLKNTTTTGVLSVQATPIPTADGGTNATTAAAALANLGGATAVAQGRAKNGATTYYSIPGVFVGAIATTTVTLDTIRYTPIFIPTAITLDQLAIEVSTPSGTGGSTARMGIYNADTDWQPTSLVVDAGTVATDSGGVKTATINQALPPGRYLLAINASVSVACRAFRAGILGNTLADSLGASAFLSNTRVAAAYAAFAGTGVAWNAASSSSTPMEYVVVCRTSVP